MAKKSNVAPKRKPTKKTKSAKSKVKIPKPKKLEDLSELESRVKFLEEMIDDLVSRHSS